MLQNFVWYSSILLHCVRKVIYCTVLVEACWGWQRIISQCTYILGQWALYNLCSLLIQFKLVYEPSFMNSLVRTRYTVHSIFAPNQPGGTRMYDWRSINLKCYLLPSILPKKKKKEKKFYFTTMVLQDELFLFVFWKNWRKIFRNYLTFNKD